MKPQSIESYLFGCVVWLVITIGFEDTKAVFANQTDTPGEQSVRIEKGIRYGRGGDTDLFLDLASPVTIVSKHPAIVFIHGGGWYTGNRDQYHNEIRMAAERGYVAVTVSYRLTPFENRKTRTDQPANCFPAQIEDIKCAIRWLRANAEKYHVDSERIGIKGSSAGGHLSLLAGVTSTEMGFEGTGGNSGVSSRVQAVVNYYGPTDLLKLHASGTKASLMVEQLMGGAPGKDSLLNSNKILDPYQLASPIHHLSADDPPILSIHGDKDPIVPIDQATSFDERAKSKGVSHVLLRFADQAHGFSGESRKTAIEASFTFFDRHLKVQRPNIVLMMADDLGWGDTGYNGHRILRTPHLDKMVEQGLKFNRFYSASPVCSPTRGSCLTGRHASRYGIKTANDGTLKDREICLAEFLSSCGYATGHFGKWHLGTLTTNLVDSNRGKPGNHQDFSPPWRHGFQTCFSTEALVPTWLDIGDYEKQKTRYWTGQDKTVDSSMIQGDDSRILVDQARMFIEKSVSQSRPFFAVIWFHTPHYPVVGSPEHRSLYPNLSEDEQHYFASITAMDEQIGRLRNCLKEQSVDRNTLVWFCSDNGPEGNPGPQKRSQGTAEPFRGRKRSLYEGGIRVPGILVWPQEIVQSRESNVPCVTSDFFPTIVDAVGMAVSKSIPYDGISLMPVIRQQQQQRESRISFQFETQSAISGDRYKLVHNPSMKRLSSDNGTVPVSEWELYDLINDPGEKQDIAPNEPEIVTDLKSELLKWKGSCQASNEGRDYEEQPLR